MEGKIRDLAEKLVDDVEKVRSESKDAKDIVGIEIMALNALSNAYKAIEND